MLYFLSCHMFQHSLVIYKLQRAYASCWGPGKWKFITTTLTVACSSNKIETGSKPRLNITQKTYFNYLIPLLIAVQQFFLILLFCLDSPCPLSAIFSNLLENYSTYLQGTKTQILPEIHVQCSPQVGCFVWSERCQFLMMICFLFEI